MRCSLYSLLQRAAKVGHRVVADDEADGVEEPEEACGRGAGRRGGPRVARAGAGTGRMCGSRGLLPLKMFCVNELTCTTVTTMTAIVQASWPTWYL